MNSLARFFTLVALVWVLAWLPIGLWVGDFDYVLRPVSRHSFERQVYQILLYLGLLLVFVDSWRRQRPKRPRWGKLAYLFFYFAQGLIATVILRGLLQHSGYATWSTVPWKAGFLFEVALSSLAVGLVEEAVFRGFLLPKLVERWGWSKGVWLSSLLFASVHLFRPGSITLKITYGIGLLLLGYLLANLAWRHNSLFASAGFHSGVIFLNIGTSLESFTPSVWSGWEREPVSGVLSWVMTLLFWMAWMKVAFGGKHRSDK